MAMGYSACFAQEITKDLMVKVVGEELYGRFEKALAEAENDPDFEHYEGDYMDCCDINFDARPALDEAIKAVAEKFKAETGIGVSLSYHGGDDCGDRYDEVNGWYWDANFSDMFTETETYKALKAKFGNDAGRRQFFVVFG